MSEAATITLISAEEFLAMPEDGMDRWLIRGELREKPMTYRNRWHSRIEANIVYYLKVWLAQQPEPRGAVHSGEAGCRLRKDPDTVVGIDVVYISAELAAQEPEDTSIIDGVPVLAAEVLSPSDKHDEITEKIDEFLETGVALVWVVDPHFETVTVYRPDAEPELFSVSQELTAEPPLPGFRVPVANIFE
jgi:Uma2 family endonuclease